MKWIGQQIWDLASRFRDDVYFEDLAETTETRGLVVDADGKLSINPLSGDEHATHIYENVRNDEGSTIPVGTPVYSKGEIGGSERILVGIADASDPAKMPAIGITNTELTTTGDTKDGLITIVGVYNTNISGFSGLSVNNIVYVASGGGLTITKPTGVNLIQNVGIIIKTNGSIIQGLQVTCVGRTNDVPTPLYIDHTNQRLGIGTTSPGYKLEVNGTGSFFGNIRSGGGTLWSDLNGGVQLGYNSSDATGYLTTYYDSTSVVIGAGISQKTGITINGQSASAGNQITFRVGNAERMRITDTGNVGIGTESPISMLHIVSGGSPSITIQDSDGTDQYATINHNNGANQYIARNNTSNGQHVWFGQTGVSSFTERMRIDSSGNVGIGTTSPSGKLNIVSSSSGSYLLNLDYHDNTDGGGFYQSGSTGLTLFLKNSSAATKVQISSESASYFNGGNVGIGTSSPTHKLDISGGKIQINDGGATWFGSDGTGGFVRTFNGNTFRFLDSSGGETMRIDNTNDRVGIGTSSPISSLDVNGTISLSGETENKLYKASTSPANGTTTNTTVLYGRQIDLYALDDIVLRTGTSSNDDIIFFAGNSEKAIIKGTGLVGIGTSSPSGKLHVSDVADFFTDLDGSDGALVLKESGGNAWRFGNKSADDSFNITQSETSLSSNVRFTIANGGNVGIGTTSPSSTLNINGGTGGLSTGLTFGDGDTGIWESADDVLRFSTASTTRVLINASGNVGIGTTSPASLLHVAGTVQVGVDDAGHDVTFFGATSGRYLWWDESEDALKFRDNTALKIGSGSDLQIKHDGSNSYISQYDGGNLYIQQHVNDADLVLQCDDGSGGTTEYFRLDGSLASGGTVYTAFPDNSVATFGSGYDLKIYHDGSNSYIKDSGSGSLYTLTDAYRLTNAAGTENMIWAAENSFVKLYYNNFAKLETVTGGVEITGDVIASGNIVDGATKIKVLPHQFMSNEDGGANKSAQFRDETIIGVRTSSDDAELYAFVEIPYGKTARTVTVYGNDTSLVVNVYESDINAGALTDKTPGGGCVVGTSCDITDVAHSATNYLVIKVTTLNYTNDVIYGAEVVIG